MIRFAILLILAAGVARADGPAAKILVRLEAPGVCANQPNEIWVSNRKLLEYQGDLPDHGTAEFHVMPGKHNITVTGKGGCFADVSVDAREGKLAELDIRLAASPRVAKLAREKGNREPASSGMYWGNDCPYCSTQFNNYGTLPYFYSPMANYPWWGNYGPYAYPNFYNPGAMNGWGLQANAYPYWGSHGAGKPNLYLSGPPGAEVKVKVNFPSDSYPLAAIPAHLDSGWSGKLGAGGKIASKDAKYGFLHYDYRADGTKLQAGRGFCADREDLMPRMVKVLESKGFGTDEIRDFREYWSIKLPVSPEMCVFPQEDAEIGKVALLEIEPKPAKVTRILFVIIPKEAFAAGGAGGFGKPPEVAWTATETGRTPAANEQTASGIAAKEWGVAFPFAPK